MDASLAERRGSSILSRFVSPPQVSSPPTMAESLGRSMSAPGPKVVITWLRRNCPCALPFTRRRPRPADWRDPEKQVHLRLHVAKRSVGAKLPVVGGFEVGVQHLPKQRLAGRGFVSLVLHRHPVTAVVVADRAPGIEQVADAVPNAAQPFGTFGVVPEGLLADPCPECVEQQRFERRAFHLDAFHPLRRRHRRPGVAGQRHQRSRKAPVQGARGERGHARDLDRAVEGLVVVPKTLVMGTIRGLWTL